MRKRKSDLSKITRRARMAKLRRDNESPQIRAIRLATNRFRTYESRLNESSLQRSQRLERSRLRHAMIRKQQKNQKMKEQRLALVRQCNDTQQGISITITSNNYIQEDCEHGVSRDPLQTSNFEGLSLKIENGLDVYGEPSVYYGIKESLLANARRLGDQEIYIKRETATPDDMHELQLENCNTLHYSLPCIEHIEIKEEPEQNYNEYV